MTKIIFKNLDSSELAKQIVLERIADLIVKFPDLETHRIVVTLSMNNSSTQVGPDEFRVKYHIKGKKFANLILEKKAETIYKALAAVNEATLELLNRTIDKLRVKNRAKSRKAKYQSEPNQTKNIFPSENEQARDL
jgi:ribosome-associated translation inhibitor RaiA